MRVACGLLAGMVFVAACSTGPSSPPESLTGTWSSWYVGHVETPNGPAVFYLTQTGDSVTGYFTERIEGASVSGSYVAPRLVLVLTDTLADQMSVDTVSGVGRTPTTIQINGTTYYKQ